MRIRRLSLMLLLTTAPLASGCLFECEEEEWNNEWECEDCGAGEPNDTVCWDDWDCRADEVCVSGFCYDDPSSGGDDDPGDDWSDPELDDRVDVPGPGEDTGGSGGDSGSEDDSGSDDHSWGDDNTTGGVCETTGGDDDSSDVVEDCDDPDESDSGDATSTDSGGNTWLCEPGRACGGIQYCTDTCFGPDCCTVQCNCNEATGTLVCDLFCWE